ncbi:thiol reductant ABC exporter subunit CydC [Natronoglycomyces albus]|nr:thiol reductant ABC exporter subunit CydC [Natronoglycomyces albus]
MMRKGPLAGLELNTTAPVLATTGICAVAKAMGMILTAWGLATAVAAIAGGWGANATWSWIETPGLVLAATGIGLRAGATWVGEAAAARTAVGFERDLRRRLLAKSLADPSGSTGARSLLATSGLDAVRPYLSRFLPALTSSAIVPLIIVAWLLYTDLLTGIIVALTVPLVPVFLALIGMHTAERTAESTRAIAHLADHVAQLVRGLPMLVGLGRAGDQAQALADLSRRVRTRTVATLRTVFLSSMALELLATMSVALVAVTVGLRLVHGTLDLQTGLLLLVLAPEAYAPFRTLGAAHHSSEDGREAVTQVRAILEQTSGTPLAALPGTPGQTSAPRISATGLSVSYHDREGQQLPSLDLTLEPGRITTLAGPSGTGKSTVLAVLAGHVTDRHAHITGSLTGLDRDRLALVNQHPTVTMRRAIDEIALHVDSSDRAPITSILAEVGLSHMGEEDPHTFSPGQRQRLALARALARVDAGLADTLLLDEPTAHLDFEAAALVAMALRARRGRATTLLVTHDAQLHGLADATVTLPASPVPNLPAEAIPTRPEPASTTAAGPAGTEPPTEADPHERGEGGALLDHSTRKRLAFSALVGIAAAAAGIALSATSAWLIVRASEQPPLLTLMVAIVGVRAFGLARAIGRWAERVSSHSAVLSCMEGLRLRLWEAMTRRGPAVMRGVGERAVSHVIGDLDRFQEQVLRAVLPPMIAVGSAIVGVAILAFLSPAAAGALALAVVAAMIGSILVARWSADRESVRMRAEAEQHVSVALEAAVDVRAHRAEGGILAHLDSVADRQSAHDRRRATVAGAVEAIVLASLGAAALLAVVIGAGQVAAGTLAATGLAVLALTPLALVEPIAAVGPAAQAAQGLGETSRRLRTVIDLPAPREPDHPQTPSQNTNSLRLRDVAVGWPAGPTIASGVDLRANPGQWTILTGDSGAGKSTVLALILGFLRPRQGRYLHGADLDAIWSPEVDTADLLTGDVRAPIAWCPQDAVFFEGTLGANLALAQPKGVLTGPSGQRRMVSALERVGLGDLLASLPDGLDTRLGPEGMGLSGGERRRLAVARALLTERPVLVLDEPTAHLDSATAAALMADLRQCTRDKAVIVVTHDALARSGDRLVSLGAAPRACGNVASAHQVGALVPESAG